MIHIRIVLNSEESGGLWRMSQIGIKKDDRRLLFVTCCEDAFPSHAQAEEDARRRAQEYMTQEFGIADGDIVWEIVPPLP